MRPPHCAGEIIKVCSPPCKRTRASMRPPHCAGEILQRQAGCATVIELQ